MAGHQDAALFIERLDRLEQPGPTRTPLELLQISIPVFVQSVRGATKRTTTACSHAFSPKYANPRRRKHMVSVPVEVRRCIQHDQRQNHLLEGVSSSGDPLFIEIAGGSTWVPY